MKFKGERWPKRMFGLWSQAAPVGSAERTVSVGTKSASAGFAVVLLHADTAGRGASHAPPLSAPRPPGQKRRGFTEMFVFFSSRLGCLGSIIASVVLTLILLVVFGVL